MDLGKRVKFYRNKKSLTQVGLAELAHVSNGLIGQIETGKAYPSIPSLKAIAKALGVRPSMLLEDETITTNDDRTIDLDNLDKLQLRYNYRLLSTSEKEKLQSIINNALNLKKEGEPCIAVVQDSPELNEEKLSKTIERIVKSVLEEEKKNNKSQRKKPLQVIKTSKNPSPSWYIEEIKKGLSLNDADSLSRLLNENIIKPTVYGHPLTQEQKEGLVKFIESHKNLLLDFKKDASVSEFPEHYAAHNEGEESLNLEKEPELAALMKASKIIVKMMHIYLEEEGKAD